MKKNFLHSNFGLIIKDVYKRQVQMMKDGITIKTDTIDMEAIRKEVEFKQPIVK